MIIDSLAVHKKNAFFVDERVVRVFAGEHNSLWFSPIPVSGGTKSPLSVWPHGRGALGIVKVKGVLKIPPRAPLFKN